MGTSPFAAAILMSLIENMNYKVVAVVTQPDKPVGRTQQFTISAVKEVALRYDLPLFQPYRIKYDYGFLPKVDFIITCSYGQLLPSAVLKLAKITPINIHASLLPKLRGAAPIQWAILNDENETGITITEMTTELDAGAIYSQRKVAIDLIDNLGSLSLKLTTAACKILLESLPKIADGRLIKQAQDLSAVT
ncbi:methionyl-tRNA formyltransferase [Cardinium endosymbiont of Tipula unca]|uniref:methionyl-tRNA formyltransferase n=1 Tax=Cardinium endosymbiont of Tipula unca TaxID=3066216 RepID=UPI0030CF89BF